MTVHIPFAGRKRPRHVFPVVHTPYDFYENP
jgi:hypothetical protein